MQKNHIINNFKLFISSLLVLLSKTAYYMSEIKLESPLSLSRGDVLPANKHKE